MADTIKEFLVKLGFQTDKSSQKDFEGALVGAQAKAVALGVAMAEMAKAIAQSMAELIPSLDNLYFQTQRLGSSAEDIKSFGYAMSQMGGSAQGANSALKGLADFIRYTPGAGSWLSRWGVNPKDLNDTVKVARELGVAFRHMNPYMAKAIANKVGLGDSDVLFTLLKPGGDKYEKQYKEFAERISKAFGVTLGDATDDANEFQSKLRELKAEASLTFDLATAKILEKLLPALEGTITAMSEWLSKGDNLNEMLKTGGVVLSAFAIAAIAVTWEFLAIAGAIGAVIVAYEKLKAIGDRQKANAVSRDIHGNSVQNGHYIGDVGASQGVVSHNPDGSSSMTWQDRALHWVATGKGMGHWEGKGSGIQNSSGVGPGKGSKVDPWFMPSLTKDGSNPDTAISSSVTGNHGTRATRNNNPGNIKDSPFARRQPGYAGSDGTFAIFSSPGAGYAAQVSLLSNYMAEGRDTLSSIVSKYAPSNENDTAAYISRMSGLTGLNPYAHLKQSDLTTVASAMDKIEGFGNTKLGGGGRGGFNQTNNVNVHGASDPAATARAVGGAIFDANQHVTAAAQRFAW